MKQYQQGDVNIVGVATIPTGAKKIEPVNGKFLVRHGESGNSHVITADPEMELYEKDGVLYLRSTKTVELEHIGPSSHHGAQVLNPKESPVWEFSPVFEEDHLKKMVRPVSD